MVSYLGVVRTVMMADTAQFNRAVRGASAEFRAAAQQMRHDAQSLVGISGALNLSITIPAIFAARSITKLGAEYEASMLKIQQTVSMTRKELDALNRTQMRLSRDAKTSPLDLAKIGYIASQAQFRSPRAIHQIQKAVTMSQRVQPGDASFEEVTTGLTKVMNAFQFSSKNAIQVVAEMNKTIRLGQLSWREYNKNVTQAAAIFSTLGEKKKSFKDMNIAVALATQGGVQGGASFTALRNLITRIYKEGRKDKSELNIAARGMGYKGIVHMFETGAGSSLTGLMQMLQAKYGTGETATGAGFMQRELAAALKLMNADIHEWRRYEAEYGNALSEFKADYEEALKSPLAIMDDVASAFKRVKLTFFASLGPTILKFMEGLAGVLEKIANLPDFHKKLIAFGVALMSLASMVTGVIGVAKTVMLGTQLGLTKKGVGNVASLVAMMREDEAKKAAAEARKLQRQELQDRKLLASVLRAESLARQQEFKEQRALAKATNKVRKQEAVYAAQVTKATQVMAVASTQVAAGYVQQTRLMLPQFADSTIRMHNLGRMMQEGLFGGTHSNRLLDAPSAPLFPHLPDKSRYTPSTTRWTGFQLLDYTEALKNPPIDMFQRPDGTYYYRGNVPPKQPVTPTTLGGYAYYPLSERFRSANPKYAMTGARQYSNVAAAARSANIKNIMGKEGTKGIPYGASSKIPFRHPAGFGGRMVKGVGGALKGFAGELAAFAKFAAIVYAVVVAIRVLANALDATLIPLINSFGGSVGNLSEVFKSFDTGLVDSLSLVLSMAFATIAQIISTVVKMLHSFGLMIGSAFSWIGDAIRSSWLGRKLGWDKNHNPIDGKWKRAEMRWDADRLVGEAFTFDVMGNAAERYWKNLYSRGKPGAYDEEAEEKKLAAAADAAAADAAARANLVEEAANILKGESRVGGAPGLFEMGTQEAYNAIISSNNALIDVLRNMRTSSETLLGKIKDAGENTEVILLEAQELLRGIKAGVTT